MLANFFKKKITSPIKTAINAIFGVISNFTTIAISSEPRTIVKEGYESCADLYAIVSYIAQKCKELELVLYRSTRDGIQEIAEHEAITIWEKSDLFNLYTYKERIEVLITDLLVTGSCYILKDKGQTRSKILHLLPIPSSEVEIIFGDESQPIKAYQVRRFYGDKYFSPDEIICVRIPSISYENGQRLYGFSPIIPAKKIIMQLNDADTAQSAMLQNGGSQGFLVPDASVERWEEITQESLEIIKKAYKENYSGVSNRGKIGVSNVPLKFIDTSKTASDLDLARMQVINLRRLAAIYKFPTALLNDNEQTTYNNIRENYKKLYIDCVLPTFNRIVDRLNAEYLKDFGLDDSYYFAIDDSKIEVLQQNKKEQIDWMVSAEAFTTNEIREAVGWGRIENEPFMDEVLVSANKKFLRDLQNFDEK